MQREWQISGQEYTVFPQPEPGARKVLSQVAFVCNFPFENALFTAKQPSSKIMVVPR